ncbi:uncharacterized protein LOC130448304 [Diorhabda sublineata]|uniref:uncharacterized protein LOC130448304 n=1 Tax=Diorhabda sublineata TaxID=1163346 RepID=UPI0024E154DA|nr:uncharacterized protein LOC130448304 [Diorhabda sublineata]
MKLPFHTFIGPVLKKNHKSIKSLCAHPTLSFSPIYVFILGILGMVLSIFDIIRIIKCGSVLPGYLWRERLKKGAIVVPEVERDLKLICLVLSTEYYSFLLIGVLTGNPIFLLPFMILYAVIIMMESFIFLMKAFAEGIDMKKSSLVMSMFMMYNWMSVFCTFCRQMTGCDI